MGDNSLTPARDLVETMLAGFAAEEGQRRARPGLEGITARIGLTLSATMSRLIADEADLGSDMEDVYVAACRAIVNAAGSAGATLLVERDTITGAVDILSDALELAENRVGQRPQQLTSPALRLKRGRA